MTSIEVYMAVCERAAREGGRVLRDYFGKVVAREKNPKDLVTDADVAAQDAICQVIQSSFPDHLIIAEENTPHVVGVYPEQPPQSQYRWIVDPLDGTANYVHCMPTFAVSVALEYAGELLVGVVYDPMGEECYAAMSGRGAVCNGASLCVSGCRELEKALVVASFAAGVQRNSPEIDRFIEILVRCQSLRRLGSAALNLAYVAAGRMDGYYATNVKSWDVAAGALIVRESGGHIASIDGGPFRLNDPKIVATSTGELQIEITSAFQWKAGRGCSDSSEGEGL